MSKTPQLSTGANESNTGRVSKSIRDEQKGYAMPAIAMCFNPECCLPFRPPTTYEPYSAFCPLCRGCIKDRAGYQEDELALAFQMLTRENA